MTRKTTQTFPPLRYGPLFFPEGDASGGTATAGATPTTDPASGAAATPTDGAGNPINLSRKEYDELLSRANKAKELEQQVGAYQHDRTHISRLLKPGTDPAKVEESMRYLMAQNGYSPEEIDAYLKADNTAGKGGGSGDADDLLGGDKGGKPNPEIEKLTQLVTGLSSKVDLSHKEIAANNERRLRGLLVDNTAQALDSHPELANLLRVVEHTTGEEGAKEAASKAKDVYLQLVRQRTLSNVQARRATERNKAGRDVWDDRWIAEEATKATDSVLQELRTVIGDPSKIGRSTETSLADLGLPDKPIEAPDPRNLEDMGDALAKLEAYNHDQLLRASVPSGASRV